MAQRAILLSSRSLNGREFPQSILKFEIIKNIGVLSESSNGWKKEVNIVSWNGGDPKYDIRSWNQDRTKMGKGVTLSSAEIEKLRELLG